MICKGIATRLMHTMYLAKCDRTRPSDIRIPFKWDQSYVTSYMRIRHCGICEISSITTVTCKRKLVDPCTIGSTSSSACVGCNSAAVDEVKYRTTWSAVDKRPFTRTNTVPVDDRAKLVSSSHALRYYHSICLEKLRKSTKTLTQDNFACVFKGVSLSMAIHAWITLRVDHPL
jgi:hypothetical protein